MPVKNTTVKNKLKKKTTADPLKSLEVELEDTELANREEQEKLHKTHKKPSGMTKKEIYAKVVKFTNEARKHYGDLIKSVLIFGSAARGDMKKTSDIDVWVILDDTTTKGSEDLNKINTHMYLIAHQLKDLHIQTTALTEFWRWVRMGSPELVNFLRYGLAIYDSGFIKPIQRMLEMGMLPPSEEAIAVKAKAAETRLKRIRLDLKSMVFELRYTATDICQAVIMHYYKKQPDHKNIPKFLRKLVKDKKLEAEYVKKFEQLNKMWKDIDHKVVKEVDTDYLKNAIKLADELITRMKKLLPKEVIVKERVDKEK